LGKGVGEGRLANAPMPNNIWRVGPVKHEGVMIVGIIFTTKRMEGMDTTPNVVATGKSVAAIATIITPNTTTTQGWQYEELVKKLMLDKKGRELCSVCKQQRDHSTCATTHPLDEDDCVFYKHEQALIKVARKELEYPEDRYKNNKEQGARLACYKLWTKLEVGKLGARQRRPLPVCVEARIKLMNPSHEFKGFKHNKEDEGEVVGHPANNEPTKRLWTSPNRPTKKPKIL